MDSTLSVSKGCFAFKNGATRDTKDAKKTPKRKSTAISSVLDNEITDQPYYVAYTQMWLRMQTHISHLQASNCARTLDQLIEYVANEQNIDEMLPTAALLTGINQPDHFKQFEMLSTRLHDKIDANVCILQSRACTTLKAAIEAMVYSFVNTTDTEDKTNLKRSQCTMKKLQLWYENNFPTTDASNRQKLVIILPDFECFNAAILQDFILILSSNYLTLPFVLILGVATVVSAVHNSLPYHVTSKIKLHVFQTQTAPAALTELLEQVLLSPQYAFHLSGKAFKFLTHIFLYYDFSLHGFIQGFKYCIIEHYFQGNAFALCNTYALSLMNIQALTHDDMETIRRQLSFRPYVEAINDCKKVIATLTDDDYLKKKLPQLLRKCHLHFMSFRCFLELLIVLVGDLPNCPLGKQRRELYSFCLSKELCTESEFKECWRVLSFMSKHEFINKIRKAVEVTQKFVETEIESLELGAECAENVYAKLTSLHKLLENLEHANDTMDANSCQAKDPERSHATEDTLRKVGSRHELKAHLLQMSKQNKETPTAMQAILDFIKTEILYKDLAPLKRAPTLYELFVFQDITSVRRNIIGAPRAALHTALNNPHFYLQCKCCELPQDSTQLLSTMPDISIVYKLHLECGRMINLYDWLQAFRTVVEELEEGEVMEQISPQIQARFTRAVSELQFLGYIKMSKRKTDHATRLTW